MNLPLFISRRIYSDQGDKRKVSRPAIRIATIGVAIGLAVMIITVSVILGFKHTVRDKVVGFGSHIQVQHKMSIGSTVPYPLCVNDTVMSDLKKVAGIKHAERYTIAQGILKTDDDFLGVMFKGVGPEFDATFMKENLLEGQLPQFCDTATQYPLVISKTMADKLRLKTGDRIFAYFIGEDDVRARKFNVCGIYQSHMKRFDDVICLTDIYATMKLNSWSPDTCSGVELLVNDFDQLETINRNVTSLFRNAQHYGLDSEYMAMPITETYRQVFDWLQLLDVNVWIILALMIAVAGFTIVSGLLIIILERTQMIGILKALGASNTMIRKTFLWFATYIIGRGLFWGNILGLGIVLLQMNTGLVKLDPQTYYVSEAPMEINVLFILLLNIGTLLISVFVLIAPSYLVSRIHPARSMRYE